MIPNTLRFMLVAAMLAVSACALQQPILNVDNAPVVTTSGKAPSPAQVRQAIIDIPYSATSYSIVFKRGENLDVAEGTIHKNYNGWVQNLDRAIRTEISLL